LAAKLICTQFGTNIFYFSCIPCVARDWGIITSQHTTTNKRQPQHTAITLSPDHGQCPPVKPWGKNDNVIVAAPEALGTNFNSLPLPDWRRQPKKRRKV
jgi:hypothetical protein